MGKKDTSPSERNFSPWIRAESSDFASFSNCVFPHLRFLRYVIWYLCNQSWPILTFRKWSFTVKGATFFGRQVLPIIRSQRQLGYLDGSIPSPPRMIEEVSTRKEETTTKTLVQNPAYKDWICTASPPPVGYRKRKSARSTLAWPAYLWSANFEIFDPKPQIRILLWLSLLRGTIFRQTERRKRK